jgi:hypothetical protein
MRPCAQNIRLVLSSLFGQFWRLRCSQVIPAQNNCACAVGSTAIPVKAPPVADMSFFSANDNYLTYSYLPEGADPGVLGKTEKQLYSFSHFDGWAYGTNFTNFQPVVRFSQIEG